jgi:lysophospholipase L1-like esterase
MKRPTTARLLPCAVIVAICACGAFNASASATSAPVTPGSRYLAIGDSVTFGYQEPGVVPAPDYRNAASFLGYPELLGAELHLTVANPACPGETSASLINPTGPSNGCENTPGDPHAGYRVSNPLHVRYKGSQLAYALRYLRAHRDVRLVSLLIGANDYFRCSTITKDGCASRAEKSAVLANVGRNIRKILSTIRNKAHYAGQLVILGYYSLNYASAATDALVKSLNSDAAAAARPFHVTLADSYDELRLAAARSGGDSCKAGLLTQLSKGGCGIHPTYAGQALLAEAVEKAIRL